MINPHAGLADHQQTTAVRIGDCIPQAVPHSGPDRATGAAIGRMRAIARGQFVPRRSRTQHPEYPVPNPTVIDTRSATRLFRQQRRDHTPIELGKFVSARGGTLHGSLESLNGQIKNLVNEFTA